MKSNPYQANANDKKQISMNINKNYLINNFINNNFIKNTRKLI